ncbi:MAG: glycosyltransferase family 4 protein, partial [Bacteroidota bacterium]
MKILMTGLLPTDLSEVKGGVVSVILNFLEAYSRVPGVQVTHLSFNEEIDEPLIVQYAPNVTLRYLPFRSRLAMLDYRINRAPMMQIIREESPDILHIQEVTPQLFRFLFLNRDRVVVTQHGIMREEYKTAIGWKKKLKSLFKGQVERLIFPRFRNIIFISNYNRQLFNGQPARQALIYNPVHRMFITGSPGPGDPHNILYVGVINVNKNLQLVLRALGTLRRSGIIYRLQVVGGYKDASYSSVIERLLDEYGVSDLVTFHGWKRQEDILALHATCAIFILPSMQENMPVSIAESMSTGRVVIASEVGAISEMFMDRHSGFLFPRNDLGRLCSILTDLHQDPALLESVATNARREALERFHPDAVVG